MSTNARKSWKDKDGQWVHSGYRFDQDDVASQMAYLFAGKEGQQRAKAICEEAEKIADPEQRKNYIAEEVKKKASDVDQRFQDGLMDIIKKFPKSGKDLSGPEAGKEQAVNLMKLLGLNVDADNVQTNYSPGPPQCFQISWINRPTAELKDEQSEINKLSNCYANSLNPEAQKDFSEKWAGHVANAKNGGPKMEKTAFELEASKKWSDFKKGAKQEYQQSVSDSLNQNENQQDQTSRPG